MKYLIAIFALTVLFSTIGVQSAFAIHEETMYAGESSNSPISPGAINIVDVFSGGEVFVGDDRAKLSGLAFDNSDRLFGTIPVSGGATSLVEINPDTGLNIAGPFVISDGLNSRGVTDLTVNPISNDLWGITGYNDPIGAGLLLIIDKNTGFVLSELGPLFSNDPLLDPSGGGLAFNEDGNILYYSDTASGFFYLVNPDTFNEIDSFQTIDFFQEVSDVIIFDGLGVSSDGFVFGTRSGAIVDAGSIYPIDPIGQTLGPVLPTSSGYGDLDFRSTSPGIGSISGFKLDDASGLGVPNITICLDNFFFGEGEFDGLAFGGIDFFLTPAFAGGPGFGFFECTWTDVNGFYIFGNVSFGTHTVFEGSDTTIPVGPRSQTVVLTESNPDAQNVNFVNRPILPNPTDITIEPSSWDHNGFPGVYWGNPTVYTKDVTNVCTDGIANGVSLTIGPFSEVSSAPQIQVEMLPLELGSPIWTVEVPPFNQLNPAPHGVAPLLFEVDCPIEGPVIEDASIYIDPSGRIFDACTDLPIEGATAILYQELNGFFVEAPETFPSVMIPNTNPLFSDATGYYGWDVIKGTWRVDVSSLGYQPQSSDNLVIPPAVTNLDFFLLPDGIITEADCPSMTTLQQQKADQIPILEILVDDADKKTAKELNKAIKSINKSVADKLWDDSTTLNEKHGHKVFDEEKKAVKSLLKIQKKVPSVDVSGVIDVLVEVDGQLAQNAIDEAGEFAGDKKVDKEIAKANKAMDKALEKLDDKPDKAIDEYKKAWKHAQKALEHADDDEDD